MGHHTQYIVSLSQEEKNKLQAMSKDNKLSARVSKRVLILLALDDKKNSNLNHRQIASALNTTVTTIVAPARDYFQMDWNMPFPIIIILLLCVHIK